MSQLIRFSLNVFTLLGGQQVIERPAALVLPWLPGLTYSDSSKEEQLSKSSSSGGGDICSS